MSFSHEENRHKSQDMKNSRHKLYVLWKNDTRILQFKAASERIETRFGFFIKIIVLSDETDPFLYSVSKLREVTLFYLVKPFVLQNNLLENWFLNALFWLIPCCLSDIWKLYYLF